PGARAGAAPRSLPRARHRPGDRHAAPGADRARRGRGARAPARARRAHRARRRERAALLRAALLSRLRPRLRGPRPAPVLVQQPPGRLPRLRRRGRDRRPRPRGAPRPVARAGRLAGRTIAELTALPVSDAERAIGALRFEGREAAVAEGPLKEILPRLGFLAQVGLAYLTLDRRADTLSGGEAQRIRLAAQLGSNLRGVCYILDEPTIGLHPRDNAMLLDTLECLRARGNTL